MGFYLAIAQIDKVKIVHIMDSEFRDYREIDIKNCKQVKFSNGGHLLTCVDNKDINVFNFFNYSRPHKMQSPSGKVTDLCFNHDDTVMTVVTEDGFIQKYDLVKFIKTGENFINKKFKFQSCMFSKFVDSGPSQSERLYTVGHTDPLNNDQIQAVSLIQFDEKDKEQVNFDSTV